MSRATPALAALAGMLLLLGACSAAPADAGKGGKGRGNLTFAVDAMPVTAKKSAYIVSAPGTIDAFERVQVTSRVAGAVDRVAFSEGALVKKGDVLVAIDSERFRLTAASAQAALSKADAALTDAEAMIKRREGASGENPGLIPGEELATYRTKSLTAKADRDAALAALQTAQVNTRDSTVRAPMDGVIQTRTIETGQYVQPGYVMATLLRSEPMLLRFQVEPRDAPRLDLGMTVGFAMRETSRKFTARLTLIAGAADLNTHMVSVTGEVVADGHKYWLRPGSFCDVTIEINADREAVIIPRTAARATDHGYVAYSVDGDVAREHLLTLGMSTKDGWIEVRSGLAAGDLLVVHGAEALGDGAKVKVTRVTEQSLKSKAADAADAGAPGASSASSGEPGQRRAPAPSASASAGVAP